MGTQFKARSTEVITEEENIRVLNETLDSSGGSLDEPLSDGEENGADSLTLSGTIADPTGTSPDRRILLQEILDSMIDEVDRQLVHGILKGRSQIDLAKELNVDQATISRRLRKLGHTLS